jgi:hypothetical protein
MPSSGFGTSVLSVCCPGRADLRKAQPGKAAERRADPRAGLQGARGDSHPSALVPTAAGSRISCETAARLTVARVQLPGAHVV